ncbi:MAG TPA: ATP-binding cassette domain-containing protein [Treponemataceae bacterium]|nr:ATP-binding cassette domain-containing protein [Spirochaetaceae bacterium]HOE08254.1 ATP-binding cassette domain-containing protein [Treponemataceae bacterium]HQL05620.1 ATP-binding cassette domain-containing protein [Treponemataceae bacterium]
MNECILRMKGISKSFSGVKVLDDVEFNVRSGTVHSLMGENGAGKSTLMKCLFGIYQKDAGEIYLDNKLINFVDPKHALEHGVSMVHQELNQVIQRSISDNIWLGRYPKKGLFIDEKKMKRDTIELFEKIEIEIDPNTPLHKLSVAQRQMVEITKAISYNAKVIVFDEPTSSLTDKEVTMLFKIIQKLKTQGVGIVYISHKMDEIFQISDDVTVLRDGKYIGTDNVANLNIDKVVNMMVGRNLEQRFPEKTNIPGEVHLSVKNISTKYEPRIHDISFDLRRGEILGIAGLVGAGRTELIESIFGVRTKESGEIYLDGSQIINRNPTDSIKNRFAFLTEERRATGIYPIADITFNTTISNINAYKNKIGFLQHRKMIQDTNKQVSAMRIKIPGIKEPIRSLSGGNQQKVIIGRWLLTNPDILLLDEPTRGIDVGAKYEIYQLIINLAQSGKSVIIVSSEMPELIGITNRILVMSNGYVSGIVETGKTTQQEIFQLASKYLNQKREASL